MKVLINLNTKGILPMARPLRIEYPGACYHVLNRGNQRLIVFREDADYKLFLEKLELFSKQFSVEIRSYCLMPNHFHLYLKTANANLSRFMQSFLTSFTIVMNHRYNTSGHLFQGRFKSFLVEDEAFGSRVSRYIHLNPIRIEAIRDCDPIELQNTVRDFPWSSYGRIIGIRPCPRWLFRKSVLCRWGSKLREQQKAYSEYVESGILKNMNDPLDLEATHSILGRDRFTDKVRRGISSVLEKQNLRREIGQEMGLKASVDLESLIQAVSGEYKVDFKELLKRYNRGNEGRQVLLYLASVHCRGRYSLSQIGERLGQISVGALTRAREKMENRLKKEKKLEQQVKRIRKRL